MSNLFFINDKVPEVVSFNGQDCKAIYYNGNLIWPAALAANYGVRFTSDKPFKLVITKGWDGVLEYSTDRGISWTQSTVDYFDINGGSFYNEGTRQYTIVLRGIGNTVISNEDANIVVQASSTTTQVKVSGDIEYLLDYKTVEDGGHPTMGPGCFSYLFHGSENLVDASELKLPSTNLTNSCYSTMFGACTKLTTAPKLPATTLAPYCYESMFDMTESYQTGKLSKAPTLPATQLQERCYYAMFAGCSLTAIPALRATSLPDSCYYWMFAETGITFSTTKTSTHTYTYRIPTDGTCYYIGSSAVENMFDNYLTPPTNTTFYVNVPVVN